MARSGAPSARQELYKTAATRLSQPRLPGGPARDHPSDRLRMLADEVQERSEHGALPRSGPDHHQRDANGIWFDQDRRIRAEMSTRTTPSGQSRRTPLRSSASSRQRGRRRPATRGASMSTDRRNARFGLWVAVSDSAVASELTMACPCGIGAVPTASLQLTRRPRRYPRGSSIGTGGMLGDFSTHSSVGPPQPVPPDGGAVQQAADEFPPRLQRTLDLRLAPDQLAALVEIHRAVAGHLDRKALFTAIAQVLQRVVPVSLRSSVRWSRGGNSS